MNGYSLFEIPLYLHVLGWKNFVTLMVNYIYPKLIHMFFTNVMVDDEILEITSYIKGHIILLNISVNG